MCVDLRAQRLSPISACPGNAKHNAASLSGGQGLLGVLASHVALMLGSGGKHVKR
jgi:hypothetical protein